MGTNAARTSFSVAMATRNGAAFIAAQLSSILAQNLLPSEIVIADDASSDDTVEIARRTVGASIPLKILQNAEPLGVTRNFERAVSACTSELIALCDQDDVWHPNRLSAVAPMFAERPGLLLVHGNARLVDKAGNPLSHSLFEALEISQRERGQVHTGDAFRVFLRRNIATGATTVFRRHLLTHALPFPAGWVHDEWLAVVASATGEVDLVEESLIDYRQHGANQIGASKLSFVGKVRRVLEPRGARNQRLVANFSDLAIRLEAIADQVASETLTYARGKLAHEESRSALPVWRIRRLAPVLRQAARGNYGKFSRGWMDVLRDLIQPAS